MDASVENSTEVFLEEAKEPHILKEIHSRLDLEAKRTSKNLLRISSREDLTAESSVRYHERSAAVREGRNNDNLSSEALSTLTVDDQDGNYLTAGLISGITFSIVGLFCGASIIGFIIYRRRFINKPQTLNEPDSSGYIDDSTIRVSFKYIFFFIVKKDLS